MRETNDGHDGPGFGSRPTVLIAPKETRGNASRPVGANVRENTDCPEDLCGSGLSR
jgi:hypothetical protein